MADTLMLQMVYSGCRRNVSTGTSQAVWPSVQHCKPTLFCQNGMFEIIFEFESVCGGGMTDASHSKPDKHCIRHK